MRYEHSFALRLLQYVILKIDFYLILLLKSIEGADKVKILSIFIKTTNNTG